MYKLSKDYKLLFEKICDGHVAACFVDYMIRCGDGYKPHPIRDICQIKRKDEYEISISARGISYGNIYDFDSVHGTEEEVFINTCKAGNIEWIQP